MPVPAMGFRPVGHCRTSDRAGSEERRRVATTASTVGTEVVIPDERDRVVDLARALSLCMVAIGHWLVTDVQSAADGTLRVTDVLGELPGLSGITWLFQVMPVFFFAGGVVAFPSWRRHRQDGGAWGAWMSRRLLRLWWPTVTVLLFWVVAAQVASRAFGVPAEVLGATRGIALVIWFLAIYVFVVALTGVLEHVAERYGLAVPVALTVGAATVDVIGFATGYVSTTRPSWLWINYLLVWSAVYVLGRWWGDLADHRPRLGAAVAAAGAVVLVLLVTIGPYPVSMVGVAGQTRSNSLPPTMALLTLGVVQVGVLWWLRPTLSRWLRPRSRYLPVAAVGARAMTLYLWHLLAVALLTVAVVLPGLWPRTEVGTPGWWAARIGWVVVAAAITLPVVLLVSRVEAPPRRLRTTSVAWRVAAATITAGIGWAALAILGFHVADAPFELPWIALAATAATAALLSANRANPGAIG